MRARGPRTQALCAARAHWFRQCRRRCGQDARVPRRIAQHGLTGFGNAEADAGRKPAYPGALRSTGSLGHAVTKQMRARCPRTQAHCAARAHWFRQCRSRCGQDARVPRRIAQHGLTGFGNDEADAGQRPAYPGALRSGDSPVSTMTKQMRPKARVPRRFAQRARTGFDNDEADAAESPRTQALCAARTLRFPQ